MRRSVALLALASAVVGVAGEDVYIFRTRARETAKSLRLELAELHGRASTVLEGPSRADDLPFSGVSLGFAMPYLGAQPTGRVNVGPDGAVFVGAYPPETHPCKSLASSSCKGSLTDEYGAVAAYLSDLVPGKTESEVLVYNRTDDLAAVSVLWRNRVFQNPTAMPDTVGPETATFAVSLFEDGRITFRYEALPEFASIAWTDRGSLWAGVRAVKGTPMRLTANEKRLQCAWKTSLPALNDVACETGLATNNDFVAASLLDPGAVKSDSEVHMCMVGDRDAVTLESSQVCVQAELVTTPNAALPPAARLRVPMAALGCLRAGFDLFCVLDDSSFDVDLGTIDLASITAGANVSGLWASPAFLEESDKDMITCDMPDDTAEDDLATLRLVYSQVESMAAVNRVVNASTLCEPAAPPEASTPCEGGDVRDREGRCCPEDELDCEGVCDGAFAVGKPGRNSPLLQCCLRSSLDCTSVCDGECDQCDGESCVDFGPLPTSRPTVYTGPASTVLGRVSLISLMVVLAVIAGVTVRRIRYYVFGEDLSPWMTALQLAERRERRRERLTKEEVDKYTTTFEYSATAQGRAHVARRSLTRAGLEQARAATAAAKGGAAALAVATGPALGEDGEPAQAADLEADNESEAKAGPESGEDPLCAICICEFEEGEKCRELPCEHIFHSDCIEEWFERSVQCPMCKADVRGENKEEVSQEETQPASTTVPDI